MKHSFAVLAVFAAACTPLTPAKSSSAVLAPERSWVIVSKPAQPAALDVVRMFQQRGFPLVDMVGDSRGVLLRFKGERKVVSEQLIDTYDALAIAAEVAVALDTKSEDHHHHHYSAPHIETYELGSVYYVRVEPRGDTMTSISAVGRPTRSGIDVCTADIDAPCAPLETGPAVSYEVAGYAEAEVIHGVLTELRLEGSVVAPALPSPQAARVAMSARRCLERRAEVHAAAARVSNPRAKAGILRTAPNCDAAAPSLASQ